MVSAATNMSCAIHEVTTQCMPVDPDHARSVFHGRACCYGVHQIRECPPGRERRGPATDGRAGRVCQLSERCCCQLSASAFVTHGIFCELGHRHGIWHGERHQRVLDLGSAGGGDHRVVDGGEGDGHARHEQQRRVGCKK
jgi:hypothetical protein